MPALFTKNLSEWQSREGKKNTELYMLENLPNCFEYIRQNIYYTYVFLLMVIYSRNQWKNSCNKIMTHWSYQIKKVTNFDSQKFACDHDSNVVTMKPKSVVTWAGIRSWWCQLWDKCDPRCYTTAPSAQDQLWRLNQMLIGEESQNFNTLSVSILRLLSHHF